jgi:hypothetical protein
LDGVAITLNQQGKAVIYIDTEQARHKYQYNVKTHFILQFKYDKAKFGTDKIYEQIYGKYFKKYYAGKPTKKYLKLWQKLREADGISEQDLIAWLRT